MILNYSLKVIINVLFMKYFVLVKLYLVIIFVIFFQNKLMKMKNIVFQFEVKNK